MDCVPVIPADPPAVSLFPLFGPGWDAPRVLAELDKAFRAATPGQQLEGVLFSGTLACSRQKDPVWVNTVYLKLAEVFRTTCALLSSFVNATKE